MAIEKKAGAVSTDMERCIILLRKLRCVCVGVYRKESGRIYTKLLIVIIKGGWGRDFTFWFKYFDLCIRKSSI